jgi:hypothetical protein
MSVSLETYHASNPLHKSILIDLLDLELNTTTYYDSIKEASIALNIASLRPYRASAGEGGIISGYFNRVLLASPTQTKKPYKGRYVFGPSLKKRN